MPLTRTVIAEKGVVLVLGSGDVTGDEFADETWAQAEKPPLPPPYHCLFDLREVRFVGDLDGFKRLAAGVAAADWPRGQRIAQVVASEHIFGLARMFDMLAEAGPAEYRVFSDLDEAWDWLGAAPSVTSNG
jgi:hypothetical protein